MNEALTLLFSMIGTANGVENVQNWFAVDPAVAQRMHAATRQSSTFLQRINVISVVEKAGQKIGIGGGLTAGRTNTDNNNRRHPKAKHNTVAIDYVCRKVNFDHSISYNELDAWAHQKDFANLVNQNNELSKALSLICMGFNGKTYAVETDIVANPLLQDVARGWLQRVREDAPTQVAGWEPGQIGTTAKPVKFGDAQAFKNLDAVVVAHHNEFVADEFAARPDMVVLCNRKTLGDKYFGYVNEAGVKATEAKAANDLLVANKQLGGLDAVAVPFFPEDTLFITPLANLSIYMQTAGKRRKVADEPEYDRIANYESENLDYVVEEFAACVLIENLEFVA